MKQEFKKTWNSSVQPRKQRKYRANAPKHIKGKFLSAPLAKDLQKEHKTRSLRIKQGDEIEVLRGSHKGEVGVVNKVDVENTKVFVEGIERISPTGSRKLIALDPSNLRIIKIDEEDQKRLNK